MWKSHVEEARRDCILEDIQKRSRSVERNVKLKKKIDKKDTQLLMKCQEWLMCCEAIQEEVQEHPLNELSQYQEKKDVMKELSEQIQQSRDSIQQLTVKLTTYSDVNQNTISDGIKQKQKGFRMRKQVEMILFYGVLLFIVMILSSTFNGQKSNGVPRNIGGYAPMTILTQSMQRVYPQNSLVIAKVTDPKTLMIGDDVTYIKENNTTVTHRVVGIDENYGGTGERGFETKGVENSRKDEEVVRSENIIGKVVFSNLLLGEVILIIRKNMVLTAITVITVIIFSDVLMKYIKNYQKRRRMG